MDNFSVHSEKDRAEMLQSIGLQTIDELFAKIPQQVRVDGVDLPDGLSEMQAERELRSLAAKNRTSYANFIGAGAEKHFIPAGVAQIAQRFEFNTAYTPYQPEISQGTLQMIYEFQSMICNLSGMEVANASVYDAAEACAEALLMAVRITGYQKVLVKSSLNPEYKKVIDTYMHAQGLEVVYFDNLSEVNSLNDDFACVLVQNPDFYGEIEDVSEYKQVFAGKKTLLVVCANVMPMVILKSLGESGADIVAGDVQSFGVPVNFGGPYGGFIACLDKYKRQLPGRIVGRTLDGDGKQAFTLTLQTREQHIRRQKATSNICSNQGLVALCASVYMTVMGTFGVKHAAYLSAKNAHDLAKGLQNKGLKVLNKDFFNEFVVEVDNSDNFLAKLKKENILAGLKLDEKRVLVCATEMNTKEEIEDYISKV